MKVCTIDYLDDVNRILRHPDVYNCISDDISPKIEEFTAESLLASGTNVIMPNDNTVFVFIPHNGITYDIHITTTPGARGEQAIKAGWKALEYAFNNIDNCQKLICFIPEIYKNVIKYTMQFGFEKEGELKNSYLKNGNLYNEIILGLRRDKWEQQQQ